MYRLFDYFKENSNFIDSKTNVSVKQFFSNLASRAKNSDRKGPVKYCWHGADIFYVPRRKLAQFYWLSSLFARFNVRLGFAVPTMLAMLAEPGHDSIEVFKGQWTWLGKRFDFADYSKVEYFAHPAKISTFVGSIGNQFCGTFVQDRIDFG